MTWIDKIRTNARGGWFITLLLFVLFLAGMKDLISRVLTCLYEFFIGSSNHVAPV